MPISILGWQNDIEKVLSPAGMVVLTGDNEGATLTLIVAGMAGLALVTTNVGIVPEVILAGTARILTGLGLQK